MRIGSYELTLEKRVTLTGWEAATISILAIGLPSSRIGFPAKQRGSLLTESDAWKSTREHKPRECRMCNC